jgi:glycosyltransferase involved in cell wall biosynthesis
MTELTVIIVVKNEEKTIRKCLENVRWAEEILVIDDFSTDRTAAICREYTEKVSLGEKGNCINDNRNLAAQQASGEWLLVLDADEIVSAELAAEIRKVIIIPEKLGYNISRKNHFLGKWIDGCGWWPDLSIRLYRKGSVKWPFEIHQTLKIKDKNKVGYLNNPIIHDSYQSFSQYFEKFNYYTSRLAMEEWTKGIRPSAVNFILYCLIKPAFYFFKKYFFMRGFKNGFRGLFISFSSALVVIVTFAKLWELKLRDKNL